MLRFAAIGVAASVCLFVTTGVSPRSVGFGLLAVAATAVLPFLCRGRREATRPEAAGTASSRSPSSGRDHG